MPGQEEHFDTCGECGATIYPEHLEKQMAEHWEGVLLCPYCLREKRSASGVGINVVGLIGGTPPGQPDDERGTLGGGAATALADQPIAYEKRPTAIRAFGGGGGAGGMPVGQVSEHAYRRPLLRGSPNATRCKTFHCKLADGPIAYMCEQINEWVDSEDDVEIKFATSTIGVIEGKHIDPHLIVTIFY